MYQYTACGLDNIWLKNGFEKHSTSYGDGVAIHNLDGLHRVIALEIIKSTLPLTGKEFRFLRIELDFSQKIVADLMDKTAQAVATWEKGTVTLPRLADKAIRDMYMESIGEGSVAGLLAELAKLDREVHELKIELEEVSGSWAASQAA